MSEKESGLFLKENLVEISHDIDALVTQIVTTFLECTKNTNSSSSLDKLDMVRKVNPSQRDTKMEEMKEKLAKLHEKTALEATSLQQCFQLISNASYGLDKSIVNMKRARDVEPEEVIRVAQQISRTNGIAAPHFWVQGHPSRPYPIDLDFQKGQLSKIDGVKSSAELQSTGTQSILASSGQALQNLQVNDLAVLRDFDRPGDASTDDEKSPVSHTAVNGGDTREPKSKGYGFGVISSDEESSDSDSC